LTAAEERAQRSREMTDKLNARQSSPSVINDRMDVIESNIAEFNHALYDLKHAQKETLNEVKSFLSE
jgi:hypothetical protein